MTYQELIKVVLEYLADKMDKKQRIKLWNHFMEKKRETI